MAAYQLILDRRIGQYVLPEGTFVIALGNREDDDGVYIQLADPLADRFEIHYMEPNFDDWKNDYALKNGVHPLVIAYLTVKPTALHTQAAEEDSMRFATPRSWVRVSDILKHDADIHNPVIRHKIIGNVGEKEGQQFIEFCKKEASLISADSFLAGTATVPNSPEVISILVASLVSKASFLSDISDSSALTKAQRQLLEQVILALHRLPQSEYTLLGMKKLLEINRLVVKDVFLHMDEKPIQAFLKNNRHILGLSNETSPDSNWLAIWS